MNTEVKNTVIIKADGLAINSIEIESYHFDIAFMDDDEQLSPQIDLTASEEKADGTGRVVKVASFYDIKEACALLEALMLAIENHEAVFNVSATQSKRPAPRPPQIGDFNEIRNAFREHVERESRILKLDSLEADNAYLRYKSGIPNPNGNGLPLIWLHAWIPDGAIISASISVTKNGPFFQSHYKKLEANKSKIQDAFSFETIETVAVKDGSIHHFRVTKNNVDLTRTADWDTEFRWLRENLEKLYWVLQIQDMGNGWDAL